MTTTFLLVRHAAHDNVGGYLAGRLPGILLGPDGLAQAGRLAQRMQRETFAAIVSSPRERTRQTAEAIAASCGNLPVTLDPDLEEIDFGEWSGKTFDELNRDGRWATWNRERDTAATPSGDTVARVCARVLRCMGGLRKRFPEGRVVVVTHADIIKTAVLHHLGLPVGAGALLEISPASLSTLVVGDWGAKLWQLNETIS